MPANPSGSFIRGNQSGRYFGGPTLTAIHDRLSEASMVGNLVGAIHDRLCEGSMVGFSSSIYSTTHRANNAALQGVSWNGDVTTMDGSTTGGKHLQYGVSKNTTDGSPNAPSLQLDYPGSWRFRWTIKGPTRTVSVLAKQNSTGSYRPSMVVRANKDIGINNDLSASAADGSGWTLIGPISVTPTGTGSLWVELHNNNLVYPSIGWSDGSVTRPVLFDHITTT